MTIQFFKQKYNGILFTIHLIPLILASNDDFLEDWFKKIEYNEGQAKNLLLSATVDSKNLFEFDYFEELHFDTKFNKVESEFNRIYNDLKKLLIFNKELFEQTHLKYSKQFFKQQNDVCDYDDHLKDIKNLQKELKIIKKSGKDGVKDERFIENLIVDLGEKKKNINYNKMNLNIDFYKLQDHKIKQFIFLLQLQIIDDKKNENSLYFKTKIEMSNIKSQKTIDLTIENSLINEKTKIIRKSIDICVKKKEIIHNLIKIFNIALINRCYIKNKISGGIININNYISDIKSDKIPNEYLQDLSRRLDNHFEEINKILNTINFEIISYKEKIKDLQTDNNRIDLEIEQFLKKTDQVFYVHSNAHFQISKTIKLYDSLNSELNKIETSSKKTEVDQTSTEDNSNQLENNNENGIGKCIIKKKEKMTQEKAQAKYAYLLENFFSFFEESTIKYYLLMNEINILTDMEYFEMCQMKFVHLKEFKYTVYGIPQFEFNKNQILINLTELTILIILARFQI
ncbi:hypothetical protein GVAV_002630 [Gurleya vavrai]